MTNFRTPDGGCDYTPARPPGVGHWKLVIHWALVIVSLVILFSSGLLPALKQVFPPLVGPTKPFTVKSNGRLARVQTQHTKNRQETMKKEIIILCAVAALAGCSPQGGTGKDRDRTTGTSRDETTITNQGGGTSPTNANTNRFGTGSSQGGTGQSEPSQSRGSCGTSPLGPGNQLPHFV